MTTFFFVLKRFCNLGIGLGKTKFSNSLSHNRQDKSSGSNANVRLGDRTVIQRNRAFEGDQIYVDTAIATTDMLEYHLPAPLGHYVIITDRGTVYELEFCQQRDKIRLRHHDVATSILPECHTCTHELHLAPYTSTAQLLDRLLLALDHRNDGFQNV